MQLRKGVAGLPYESNYRINEYNRNNAVAYAHRWAMGRNPAYYDFENVGGDCTNFASQCVFAGSGIMNHTPTYGWYYYSSWNRTPSWTGVNYFYDFLVNNRGPGPFAEVVDVRHARPGDIAQLAFDGLPQFGHSPVIVSTGSPVDYSNILIAAHTFNADNYPVTDFGYTNIRILHIVGVRT
jgi:hypothetical protein